MTDAERALVEAVISVDDRVRSISTQSPRMPEAVLQARALVLEERMSPDIKERAYAALRDQRIAERAWSNLRLPREIIERWYPEFEQRLQAELGAKAT